MVDVSEEEIKQQLHQMDVYEFEELVADIWESYGYKTVVRKGSGDQGIDVEAIKDRPYNQRDLIQAKRYADTNKLGSSDIRNYATLYQQESEVDVVAIVTTSDFTSESESLADNLNVKTIAGDELINILSNNDTLLENVVEKRFDIEEPDSGESTDETISYDDLESELQKLKSLRNSNSDGEDMSIYVEFFDSNETKSSIKIAYQSVDYDVIIFYVVLNDRHFINSEIMTLRKVDDILGVEETAFGGALVKTSTLNVEPEIEIIRSIVGFEANIKTEFSDISLVEDQSMVGHEFSHSDQPTDSFNTPDDYTDTIEKHERQYDRHRDNRS